MQQATEPDFTWKTYRTMPRAEGRVAMRRVARACRGNMKAMATQLEVHKRSLERERLDDPWFAETIREAKDEHRAKMTADPVYRKAYSAQRKSVRVGGAA